jgi:hypothetical protein
MAAGGEGAQARAMGHGARQSFYLRDLEEPTSLVLLTFDKENDPQRASGDGLKFLVFDGGARPRLSFSGFKKQL